MNGVCVWWGGGGGGVVWGSTICDLSWVFSWLWLEEKHNL
jgi:hypothetical protein